MPLNSDEFADALGDFPDKDEFHSPEKMIHDQTNRVLLDIADKIAKLAYDIVSGDRDEDEIYDEALDLYVDAGGPAHFQGWSAALEGVLGDAVEAINSGKDPIEEIKRYASMSFEDFMGDL